MNILHYITELPTKDETLMTTQESVNSMTLRLNFVFVIFSLKDKFTDLEKTSF